jgi:hypothetical protein
MSSLTSQNTSAFIKVTPVNTDSFGVFNSKNYTVDNIMISLPSSLYYNGNSASAEISIVHKSLDSSMFMIIIPISVIENTITSFNPQSQQIVENIIYATATYAPQVNETTSQGINAFSIKDLIPKTSFYFFTLDSYMNVVTFELSSSIQIKKDIYNLLSTIVKPKSPLTVSTTIPVFKNSVGATLNKNSTSNEIYIDCQPTDQSNEVVGIEGKSLYSNELKPQIPSKLSFMMYFIYITRHPYFRIVIAFIVFFIILVIIYLGVLFTRRGLN